MEVNASVSYPCDLCGMSDPKVILAGINPTNLTDTERYKSSSKDFCTEPLVECKGCGLVFISPRRSDEEIQKAYQAGEDWDYVSQQTPRMKSFEKVLDKIERYYPKRGSILDIGAGAGFFLAVAKQRGWQTDGIELNSWLGDYGAEKFGLRIQDRPLVAGVFPEKSFDVVTLWDVLEHVPHPSQTLQVVKGLLKPGGLVALSYPDWGSIFARALKRHWWFCLSVHLYYFTPKSIRALLENQGFEVVHTSRYYQSLELQYLFERMKQYSPTLGSMGKSLTQKFMGENMAVPYYASQKMVVARIPLEV